RLPLGIERMREVARERGGTCLSDEYTDHKTPLWWECAAGHRWKARPHTVLIRGSWCPVCAHQIPLGIERMREEAKGRGGKCLSTEYKGANRYLEWECGEGHRWQATPSNVMAAVNWCPVCSPRHVPGGTKLGLPLMREIAKDRGGNCLSTKYVNSNTPLLW